MTLEALENRRRELASAVKRLRVAAMSDPQRGEELADALVDLGAVNLLAWDFAEAATVAPEAAVLAARIVASRGPSGPYASLPDAVRYFSASAQLAAVQAGLGQGEGAGRTLDGLDAWREQLGRLPVVANLPDAVALWLLVARARAALTSGVAAANALADAAEVRLHASRPAAYLSVAVHLLAADARWAAGRVESSLAHHRLALDEHRAAAADPAAMRRPAVARMVAAPVPAVYGTYAQRLVATGDGPGAISLLRAGLALLESLPVASVPADALQVARTSLAAALARAGREDEAAELVAPDEWRATRPPTPPGERIDWPQDPDRATEAGVRWQRAEQVAMFAAAASRADAERSEAQREAQARAAARERAEARAEAERAAAARAAARTAEQEDARSRGARLAAERAEREAEAARAAAEERRLALAREHARSVDPDEALAAAADLEIARRAAGEADGDAATAAALDRLATVLRPLAAVEPSYRPELAATLEALVGLLWRLGDPEGSRAVAREAKALAP